MALVQSEIVEHVVVFDFEMRRCGFFMFFIVGWQAVRLRSQLFSQQRVFVFANFSVY